MTHVGAPLLFTAVALAVSSYLTDPTMTMVALTVAAIGVFCCFGVFWTLPTAWLSGTAAAGAHRADQLDRQPRRLRRPVSDRLGQGSDRADLDRPAGARGAAADRRPPGLYGRPREQARVRRAGAGNAGLNLTRSPDGAQRNPGLRAYGSWAPGPRSAPSPGYGFSVRPLQSHRTVRRQS